MQTNNLKYFPYKLRGAGDVGKQISAFVTHEETSLAHLDLHISTSTSIDKSILSKLLPAVYVDYRNGFAPHELDCWIDHISIEMDWIAWPLMIGLK